MAIDNQISQVINLPLCYSIFTRIYSHLLAFTRIYSHSKLIIIARTKFPRGFFAYRVESHLGSWYYSVFDTNLIVWRKWNTCHPVSPRYLDGIKLLQRGGGGRVGRGCWGGGQLLVIIKYSRTRYRIELRCLWQILRRRTSSRFSKRLRKSMRAKLQPSIFTVSAHLQKKTLVNITFYMCIKSFQVSDSESS